MRSGPCLCGDTQCPSCGRAQGTYRARREPKPRPAKKVQLVAMLRYLRDAVPGMDQTCQESGETFRALIDDVLAGTK